MLFQQQRPQASKSVVLLLTRDCPIHDGCSEWIFKYLKDCICTPKDAVSFIFGLISVISWGIAEVPQIMTNYKEKSTEGVSLLFLMTWVVGDFFNLAGCLLEPATLPTQFDMALLYTITTLVLVAQTIYYGRVQKQSKPETHSIEEPLLPEKPKPTKPMEAPVMSQPTTISVPSPRKLYYTSARSLTRSATPTAGSFSGSFLTNSRESCGAGYLVSHPSLSNFHADAPRSSDLGKSEPILVRAVATGLLFIGGVSMHSHYSPFIKDTNSSGFVMSGRRLLQDSEEHSALGEMLGWGMAAIYMGGRLPQIWLNITRGTVEGLNPMMFVFALMGNTTYVGSILIRSTDWNRLKPNMPWLVDAAVCVVLDLLIISQFCYYRFIKKGSSSKCKGCCEEEAR